MFDNNDMYISSFRNTHIYITLSVFYSLSFFQLPFALSVSRHTGVPSHFYERTRANCLPGADIFILLRNWIMFIEIKMKLLCAVKLGSVLAVHTRSHNTYRIYERIEYVLFLRWRWSRFYHLFLVIVCSWIHINTIPCPTSLMKFY